MKRLAPEVCWLEGKEAAMAKPLKVQIIERAKQLIQDEQHWCRGDLALDSRRISTDPNSTNAVQRCAMGALVTAAYELTQNQSSGSYLAFSALRPFCGYQDIIRLNDERGHAAVLALFDQAIAVL
jgi:hypothetical protein